MPRPLGREKTPPRQLARQSSRQNWASSGNILGTTAGIGPSSPAFSLSEQIEMDDVV